MFMSIGPAELKRILPLGGVIEIRQVDYRLTYSGTIRSFSVQGNTVGVVLNDVSFRPFGRPMMVTKTNGCDVFEFDGYGSRFLNGGLIAMKSRSKASIAYVCPPKASRTKSASS